MMQLCDKYLKFISRLKVKFLIILIFKKKFKTETKRPATALQRLVYEQQRINFYSFSGSKILIKYKKRFKFAPKPLLLIYLVSHFYFSSCIFLVVLRIIFLGKNETRDNCIFCDLDETEITSSFPLIIALYPSSATLLAEAGLL